MTGLWLDGGVLRLRDDLPAPRAAGGEALVRVWLAGICNTDIELTRGYYPFAGVPGHEFVGLVESGPPELAGKRVVGEINAACGACDTCAAGRASHCPARSVLGIVNRDGAFAEFLVLPAANLHVVPDGLPDEAALFTEPLAAALEIGEQVDLRPGLRSLVVGDGKLGQLIARVLALRGCEPVVAGRHESKLALLRACGIEARTGEELAASAPGAFDLVVDCTGSPSGFEFARRAVRPRGTLVMKSTYAGPLTIDASRLVVDEITLVGSRCGPFAPALRLLASGDVDPAPLVSARYDLRDALAAFEEAARPGVLKVIIEMPEPAGTARR
jgi:threonine dehydrogenase-like Zn-dependent dehydrogenase